jgi:hypothetical protein
VNTPGFLDTDSSNIKTIKQEIKKAFDHDIILFYVFGNQGGRIRNEDIETFNQLHNAYQLRSESLIIAVNCLTSRSHEYEQNVFKCLQPKLPIQIPIQQFCFLDLIDPKHLPSKKRLQDQIMAALKLVVATNHKNIPDIQTLNDEIKAEKKRQEEIKEKLPISITLQSYRCGTRTIKIPLTATVSELITLGCGSFRWDRAYVWFGGVLSGSGTLKSYKLFDGCMVLFTRDFSSKWTSFQNFNTVKAHASK